MIRRRQETNSLSLSAEWLLEKWGITEMLIQRSL